jgi:hypothetical protein
MTRWAWTYRDALRRHPWVLRVPITGPPVTPNQTAWLEDGLRALGGTGLAEGEKLSVILLVSGYVRNERVLDGIEVLVRSRGVAPQPSTRGQTPG